MNSPWYRVALSLGTALLAWLALPVRGSHVPHVVHISVDGLRGDLLEGLVTNTPSLFPNYIRLQNEGVHTFNARCDYDISTTVPNHISMVTGRPVLQPAGQTNTVHHGYISNGGVGDSLHLDGNPHVDYFFSVFDVVHDHGGSTGFFVGKSKLGLIERSYNATNGAPDLIGADNGRDKIDVRQVRDGGTFFLVQALTNQLANDPLTYAFLHIVEPDIPGGHNYGWGSPEYNSTVRDSDTFIGRILRTIDSYPHLTGKVALIISSDHGGGGGGILDQHLDATLPENYTVPFFLWGPEIPGGVDVYDLMANRTDPGAGRPDFNAPAQPIRNSDGGNLAMALLGLGPIPGSSILPVLAGDTSFLLEWRLTGGELVLSWPSHPVGMVLETAVDPVQGTWQTVGEGITNGGRRMEFRVQAVGNGPGFYRLRRP